MRELTTDVTVDATAETVWTVLTAFERYDEWNPFMRVIGRPNEGARLLVEIRPPGRRSSRFRPTVTRAVDARELRWIGHLVTPGLFDGDHRFELEALPDGRTRLRHSERFGGALAGVLVRLFGPTIERGFEAMNAALKDRAETVESAEADRPPHPATADASDPAAPDGD